MLVGITHFVQGQTSKSSINAINNAPLRDLATTVKIAIESEDLDLDKPFVVEYTGFIGKDGKLETKTGKFTRVEGDIKLTDIAKQVLLAVSESGYFTYLEALSAGEVVISLKQDASDFSVTVSSKLKSDNAAKLAASAMSTMVSIAKMQKQQPEATENDKSDLAILNATRLTSEAQNLIIQINLPKAVFHEMLTSQLTNLKTISGKP